MPRVKRGSRRTQKRKKTLKAAKGYYGAKSKAYRVARQAVDRSRQFAYRDRRQKKRQFRRLWILRINAAARQNGITYSRLMAGLRAAGSELDRKILADLAISDPEAFAEVVDLARKSLESQSAEPQTTES